MSDAKRKRALVVCIGGGLLLLLAAGYLALVWPDHKLQRNARLLLGSSEVATVAKMGTPDAVVTAADVAAQPQKQRWGSWKPEPTRAVTNKVLLYYGVSTAVFVYFSPAGFVE